jgi:hypothetical protein
MSIEQLLPCHERKSLAGLVHLADRPCGGRRVLQTIRIRKISMRSGSLLTSRLVVRHDRCLIECFWC